MIGDTCWKGITIFFALVLSKMTIFLPNFPKSGGSMYLPSHISTYGSVTCTYTLRSKRAGEEEEELSKGAGRTDCRTPF